MTIETELKTWVKNYADFNQEQQRYTSNLSKEQCLQLDAEFIKLINKFLLNDGPDKVKIKKNFRKLALYFHPDHHDSLSAEAKWLESVLSEGHNDGSCFKTLCVCHEKLISPQNFKPLEFNDINTREDLVQWLENLRNNSETYTERNFYTSLLGLLQESTEYFDEVGKIKPTGVRALVSFLPMVFISFGTFVFAEELFVVYSLYFVLLVSGNSAGNSKSKELQDLGKTLQKISAVTATTTTTLLVHLIEMTFWASRQFYDVSLRIGTALLNPVIAESKTYDAKNEESSLFQDLILASQNNDRNEHFKTAQLKMIAAPIESYLGLLGQQFFRNFRAGGDKYRALESFIFRMRIIDQDEDLALEDKIEKASMALANVKKNTHVYAVGGKTALAINRSEHVIRLIKDSLSTKELLTFANSLD